MAHDLAQSSPGEFYLNNATGSRSAVLVQETTAEDSVVQHPIERYRPALYVLASQIVAATQNAAAKFIETKLEPLHPFQVLHVRMLITGLVCTSYIWHIRSESNVLFGIPGVRGLVLLRAFGGVCAATGFFFSIVYLSLSEATALYFLGPLGSLILTRCLSLATVHWIDCLGAVGALLGLVLIAQPEDIFGTTKSENEASGDIRGRLKGFAFGFLGICGCIISITSMRRIGTRAHPLTSVNAFAWSVVIVSALALVATPGIVWPKNPFVWACLIYIGVSGLTVEFLITSGISSDCSSSATLMLYSQIVWALVLDGIFFQVNINLWALSGVIVVISSVSLVTMTSTGNGSYAKLIQNEDEIEYMGKSDLDESDAGTSNPLREMDVRVECGFAEV